MSPGYAVAVRNVTSRHFECYLKHQSRLFKIKQKLLTGKVDYFMASTLNRYASKNISNAGLQGPFLLL